MDDGYELVVAGPGARAIAEVQPESVAAAVIEFLTGPLIEAPYGAGKELRDELAGIRSARRGTFRILYRVDGDRGEVVVLRVDHRRQVYKP